MNNDYIQEKSRSYKQVALMLVIVTYGIAMIFFAIVRATGALWFSSSAEVKELSDFSDLLTRFILYVVDAYIYIKVLTPFSFGVSSGLALILGIVHGFIPRNLRMLFSVLVYGIPPILLNKDKEYSLGSVILFFGSILVYQSLMIIGRGYDIINQASGAWGLFSIVDYKMFLLAILIGKEMRQMPWDPDHCIFLWGPFDRIAKFIGRALLKIIPKKNA